MSAAVPQIVGNYRLDKTIGQGTYGKVKLAFDVRTQEKVAVKLLDKATIKGEKQVARLQREIRFLKLLNHPNIIKVYDVIETTEYIYIVMEYAKGGELFDYIVTHKRVKEKEARVFFRQILSAVDYCHRNAIIHRDLKPENLLLDEQKNIKIIDFGFGNTYKSDGLLETFCGSPFYAAPEMILGKRYEGPEVDMWSLGVILFALLCGHLPFDDENMKELYRKIATASYTMPDHVPEPCRQLIRRMITVDPKKRATIDEIKNNHWVCDSFDGPPENFLPIRTLLMPEQLDGEVLQRLTAFGYGPDEVRTSFASLQNFSKKVIPSVATYYLLSEMLEREAEKLQQIALMKERERLEAEERQRASLEAQAQLNNAKPEQQATGIIGTLRKLSIGGFHMRAKTTDPTPSSPQTVHPQISRLKSRTNGTTSGSNNSLNSISEDEDSSEPTRLGSAAGNFGSEPAALHMQPSSVSHVSQKQQNSPLSTEEKSKLSAYSALGKSQGDQNGIFRSAHNIGRAPATTTSSSIAPSSPRPAQRQRHSVITVSAPQGSDVEMDDAELDITDTPTKSSTRSSNTKTASLDRAHTRRASALPASTASQSSNSTPTSPATSPKRGSNNSDVRNVSGWFMNVSTTSSKQPQEIVLEVTRQLLTLQSFGLRFERDPQSPWVFACEVDTVLFDKFGPVAESKAPTKKRMSEEVSDSGVADESSEGIENMAFGDGKEPPLWADSETTEETTEDMIMDEQPAPAPEVAAPRPSPLPPLSPPPSKPRVRQGSFMSSIIGGTSSNKVYFQIEVCKVPRLNLYGLHFKRLSGSVWSYKSVCNKVLSQISL